MPAKERTHLRVPDLTLVIDHSEQLDAGIGHVSIYAQVVAWVDHP